ncbi:hypothetical protein INR49_004264, partial [Caranx melampygus]
MIFPSCFCTEDAGTYFPSVKRDPGRYLQPCSDSVKTWLHSMKNAGKVLLLITSSHSDYCRLICEHILGKDFEELFDVIITNALKPGFFSLVPQQRPFRTLVNDVEEREGLPSLDKPGWYSQGNWPHLHELLKRMTGKPEPKRSPDSGSSRSAQQREVRGFWGYKDQLWPVLGNSWWKYDSCSRLLLLLPLPFGPGLQRPRLAPLFVYMWYSQPETQLRSVVYFGDSMRSDMFPASSFGKWETVMIVEEMEGEGIPKSDAAMSNEAQVEPLEKKGKFEEQGMKTPSAVSNQWGSYFVDVHQSGGGDEESQKLTWCSHCIHKYSTMAIPSVEHIA